MTELPPRFDFRAVEDKWIEYWQKENLFHAKVDPKKTPYTIVIPPPNVTGILHMGHALNNTLQDIIIRYKRMNGFEACWMPGTDHAGIATQNVVEKQLAKEGKKRQDLGREEFLKKLWEWKGQYGDTIIHQLKKIGSSCDWPRTRFTMDDEYSEAVKYTFVTLYEKGLIYQGEYIINWCPRCQTALSDEEAEHEEVQGSLYHFKYPLKDNPKEFVIVATTRPETMLGDTAVAVNPKDKRYKKFIGKTLLLPLVNREIPIVADEFVDMEFGTGAVKVTPAHDPNDFAMGQRHKLPFVNVMHPDARINEQGGSFSGLDRFEARKKIIETLKEKGLVEKIEAHKHAVGHCYRCHTIIEPYLSKQWFVKMKPLAKPAYEAVVKGDIKIYPDRWTKVYLNWMDENNVRDWCISRQIWWGHRIPVWYCLDKKKPDCQKPVVAMQAPQACPHCGTKNLKQDEDVLDTWFSSWLWPFATFGWPKANKELEYFYPTSSLLTASEIIFFWVARMIMAGFFFMGEAPFKDVYIHGTVRDAKGRKMSKSLGNAIDPLEIIQEYGADSLRFSLIVNSGQDLFVSKEKFEIGRNFANKVWNASRLILMNVKDIDASFDFHKALKDPALDLPSRWIISRFYSQVGKINQAVETFRFSEAETLVQDFFWGEFCDWYLEIIKDRWSDKLVQHVAFNILSESLKVISPFMPFVAEEIWQHLPNHKGAICVQVWPKAEKGLVDENIEGQMKVLVDLVTGIRNVRVQWNIKPNDKIELNVTAQEKGVQDILKQNSAVLKNLGKVETLNIKDKKEAVKNAAIGVIDNVHFSIPLGSLIDLEKEKQRILKQIEENKKVISSVDGRLSNEGFVSKAPADVIAKEREKRDGLAAKNKELEAALASLS